MLIALEKSQASSAWRAVPIRARSEASACRRSWMICERTLGAISREIAKSTCCHPRAAIAAFRFTSTLSPPGPRATNIASRRGPSH